MLAEAKDNSELMIDLAYAAVFFNDPGMADEVAHLEENMNDLVQSMRAVCILACRRPAEAESMASVLQLVSAIEGIANAAVDITRIVTHRLGIPRELIADLSNAEEVSHRVWVRDESHMARRTLAALELPVATGMRVMAIRRDRSWITELDGEEMLLPGDVLFDSGRDKLKKEGVDILRQVAEVIRNDPDLAKREFQVAGHTDSKPLAGGPFRDNWGLSAMRARSVLKFLTDSVEDGGGGLDPTNWSAAGYADTDPVASNDTDEGRQKNRRVELVVLPNVEEMLNLNSLAK